MKIIYVTRWFSEGMGYIENCLPHAMASLGQEVHLITSTAQVYYNLPFYEILYKKYLGEAIQKPGIYKSQNVTIHRLPFILIREHMMLKGMLFEINKIRPDVVHVFEHTAIKGCIFYFLKNAILFIPIRITQCFIP